MTHKLIKTYSYYFLLPGLLLYFLFFVLPTLFSFYYSLTDWNGLTATYIGFQNFIDIVTNPDLNITIKNTLIFTIVTTLLKAIIGLGLALLMNMGLKSQTYLRTVYFFPVILSTVAVGLLFSSLYHPTTGLINSVLQTFGLNVFMHDWLGERNLVIYSVAFVDVWKGAGFCMVIFLAGLQSIPKEYYEAVKIDGANQYQIIKNITVPMIGPAMNSVIILCLISGLRVFDIVYVTSNGGPGRASEVISTLVFREFSNGYYGLATAGGVLMFFIVSIIVFPVYYYLSRREIEL